MNKYGLRTGSLAFSVMLAFAMALVLALVPQGRAHAAGGADQGLAAAHLAVQDENAALADGTYEATSIATDVTTDESGMIMVTKATVVIKDGKADAIVTMKGVGADRFYVSDTATTHDALLEEAVAEEAKEIDGQESKLIGCYQKEGESAYTFWPIPITLGEPKVYAARSHSHFTKWDLPRKNYFYVHDFQINAADLERVSDSTDVMTPEAEAEVYMNQFYVDNGVSSDHASVIKAKGANVTVPYYEGETKISSFKFKMPSKDKYVAGWFVDKSILNSAHFSSSNLKKIRYPQGSNGTVTFNPKATYRDEGMVFSATLKLFPVGTAYNQYDASEVYFDKDSLIEKTFTITVQSKPQVDFNVGVKVTDQKSSEVIANPTITVTDEGDNSVIEPNADGTYKLNALKKYTVSASAEGYVAQGGADAATKTGFSPSKEGEVVALKLLKTADASHTLTLSIADQFGEAVANPAIRVWLYGTTSEVSPNADGSYTLWDSESYVCEVSAEGYETARIYPKLTEDEAETVTLNKYLSEHAVFYNIYDADTDETLDGVTLVVTNNTAGGTIAQNEDGSFTVPSDTSITCVASKDGYLTSDGFTHVPSGFDPVVKCSFGLKVNYETQLKQEIAKATEYASTIEEAEEPGKWPAGSKAALEGAIADAQAVLDAAASTETEFETAMAAIKTAEKAAADARNWCEANVTVRVNKNPGEAAELYKVKATGEASKTYKYAEPASVGKEVSFIDLIIAVHEQVYGDAYKDDPKKYFDSQNVGFYFIPTIFEKGNYYQFALNGDSLGNYQNCIVHDGDTADMSLLVKTNDVFLSFGELEASCPVGKPFTTNLTKGVSLRTSAAGYTVKLAQVDGDAVVEVVTDEEGNLTVTFDKPGDYMVASAVSGNASESVVQPYLKVTAYQEADYSSVGEAKAKAAALDRDLYTEESLKVVDEAVAAVEEGKKESEQADVDAMAKAIEDAIAGLVTREAQAAQDLEAAQAAVEEAEAKADEAQKAVDVAAAAAEKAEKSGTAEDAAAAVEAAERAKQAAAAAEQAAMAADEAAKAAQASAEATDSQEAIGKANAAMEAVATVAEKAAAATKAAEAAAGRAAAAEKAAADKAAAPKANPMKAQAKAVKVKAKKVKKKAQKVAANKAIAVAGAQGKVSYKLVKVSAKKKLAKQAKKKIKVAANGQIKLKKGLKKGTYKVTIAVTAAGNASYKAATQNVTVKIKVK